MQPWLTEPLAAARRDEMLRAADTHQGQEADQSGRLRLLAASGLVAVGQRLSSAGRRLAGPGPAPVTRHSGPPASAGRRPGSQPVPAAQHLA
jgi:hypothetical protein